LFVCGFEAYKAAIKTILTGGLEIPWEVLSGGLDFLEKAAAELEDKDLADRVKQARQALEAAKKAKAAKEKLEDLKKKWRTPPGSTRSSPRSAERSELLGGELTGPNPPFGFCAAMPSLTGQDLSRGNLQVRD
jgi:hypothetical protein